MNKYDKKVIEIIEEYKEWLCETDAMYHSGYCLDKPSKTFRIDKDMGDEWMLTITESDNCIIKTKDIVEMMLKVIEEIGLKEDEVKILKEWLMVEEI